MSKHMISRRQFIGITALVGGGVLAGCAAPTATPAPTKAATKAPANATAAPTAVSQPTTAPTVATKAITLRYTFWGSALEKEAMLKASRDYEAAKPGVKVEASHIPDAYEEKLTAMLAGNTLPDIGYMVEDWTGEWGNEKRLLDLEPLIQAEGRSAERVPSALFYGGGKIVGAGPELECTIMLFNKDIFDKAGEPYPPATADKAWTVEETIAVAKRLTLDANGKRPDEAGFDPKKVRQFGLGGNLPAEAMLLSNNTSWFSADGKTCQLDRPEVIEVYQKLADIVNVHHVAPTPDQAKELPLGTWQTMLSTGKVAMATAGQWLLLDVAQANVKWGIAALPKFKKPAITVFGMPVTIFSSTKFPNETYGFLAYLCNPQKVELYKNGLWMPVLKEYYEDAAKVDSWASGTEARPPEFKTAVLDYVLKHSQRGAWATLKDGPKIFDVINPELDKIYMGQAKAADVLPPLCAKIQPMLKGFWARN